MNTSILFGKQVRQIRQRLNLTQAELAEKANLSNKYISDVELGKKKISLDAAKMISDAFDMPINYFLEEQTAESIDYIVVLQECKALIESSGDIENSLSRLLNFFHELTETKWSPPLP